MMKTLRSQVLESADYLSANLENEFSSLNADVYGEDESPKKKEFFSDLESSSLDTSFNQVRMEFYLAVYNHCLFESRLEWTVISKLFFSSFKTLLITQPVC